MTAPKKWSQNISIAPCCLAVVQVIKSMLADETRVQLKIKVTVK